MDRPIPTRTAVMALGNLKFTMMYSHVSLLAIAPDKLLKTSFTGILTCPKEIFNTNVNTNNKVNEKNRIVFCFLDFKLI